MIYDNVIQDSTYVHTTYNDDDTKSLCFEDKLCLINAILSRLLLNDALKTMIITLIGLSKGNVDPNRQFGVSRKAWRENLNLPGKNEAERNVAKERIKYLTHCLKEAMEKLKLAHRPVIVIPGNHKEKRDKSYQLPILKWLNDIEFEIVNDSEFHTLYSTDKKKIFLSNKANLYLRENGWAPVTTTQKTPDVFISQTSLEKDLKRYKQLLHRIQIKTFGTLEDIENTLESKVTKPYSLIQGIRDIEQEISIIQNKLNSVAPLLLDKMNRANEGNFPLLLEEQTSKPCESFLNEIHPKEELGESLQDIQTQNENHLADNEDSDVKGEISPFLRDHEEREALSFSSGFSPDVVLDSDSLDSQKYSVTYQPEECSPLFCSQDDLSAQCLGQMVKLFFSRGISNIHAQIRGRSDNETNVGSQLDSHCYQPDNYFSIVEKDIKKCLSEKLNLMLRPYNAANDSKAVLKVSWESKTGVMLQLDDLNPDIIEKLIKKQAPLFVMETSPKNYQAVLVVAGINEQQGQLIRQQFIGLGADNGATLSFRAVGAFNLKRKYEVNGNFPIVTIIYSNPNQHVRLKDLADIIDINLVTVSNKCINTEKILSGKAAAAVSSVISSSLTSDECLELFSRYEDVKVSKSISSHAFTVFNMGYEGYRSRSVRKMDDNSSSDWSISMVLLKGGYSLGEVLDFLTRGRKDLKMLRRDYSCRTVVCAAIKSGIICSSKR